MRIPESENLDSEVGNQGVKRTMLPLKTAVLPFLAPWGLLASSAFLGLQLKDFISSRTQHDVRLSCVCLYISSLFLISAVLSSSRTLSYIITF